MKKKPNLKKPNLKSPNPIANTKKQPVTTEKLTSSNRLCFFAWVIPHPFLGALESLKKIISKKFKAKQTLKAPAHLTFIPPQTFSPDEIKKTAASLKNFNQNLTPVNVKIANVGHFGNRTIFLKTTEVTKLSEIRRGLNELLTNDLNKKISPLTKEFTPHISLANRDIPKEHFQSLYSFVKNERVKFYTQLQEISLLTWDGRKWQLKKNKKTATLKNS